ncbi:hypothetical protein [Halocatena halophila]|uniref:hypothetical protein n=1 Tax=Halocatena halophila TaxID=2814576 RepID=UPI002ED5567D
MYRRIIIHSLVVGLLILAGCNSLPATGPSSGGTSELTPAPIPTASSQTPSPAQLAPGVASYGVTDLNALSTAHHESLQNVSYTRTETVTAVFANGTIRDRFNLTARVTDDRSRIFISITQSAHASSGHSAITYELWANRTQAVSQRNSSSNTSYRTDTRRNRSVVIEEWTRTRTGFTTSYAASEMNVVEFQTENRTVIEVTGQPPPTVITDQLITPADSYTTAVVGPQGRIYNYTAQYHAMLKNPPTEATTVENTSVDVTHTVQFTSINSTTVARPSWFDTAITNRK